MKAARALADKALALLDEELKDLDAVARRMADTGVAATVLTATDLYLGGRHTDHNVPRNVVVVGGGGGTVASVASLRRGRSPRVDRS